MRVADRRDTDTSGGIEAAAPEFVREARAVAKLIEDIRTQMRAMPADAYGEARRISSVIEAIGLAPEAKAKF
jgi:hypothetical protein